MPNNHYHYQWLIYLCFQGDFNFSHIFSGERKPGSERYNSGKALLEKLTASNNFKEMDMFNILRDKESGICRGTSEPFPTTASQVFQLNFIP